MDTLHLATINFNQLMSLNDIISCYKNNEFPNAYCLVYNGLVYPELLATENRDIVMTENRKEIAIDGSSNIYL